MHLCEPVKSYIVILKYHDIEENFQYCNISAAQYYRQYRDYCDIYCS